MLNQHWLLYFACMLAGFALIHISLTGTFLASLGALIHIIGILAALVFALVIIIHGVVVLFRRI